MFIHSQIPSWLIVLAVVTGIPLLIGVSFLLARLIRVKNGLIPIGIFLLLCTIVVVSISTFLDVSGEEFLGEVTGKQESLSYSADGSWTRLLDAKVQYTPSVEAGQQVAKMRVGATRMDDLHQGDFVKVRVIKFGGLSMIRLSDESAYSQILAPLFGRIFFCVLFAGLLLVMVSRLCFHAGIAVMFFVASTSILGAWWISEALAPVYDQMRTHVGSPNTVNATVRAVHPMLRSRGATFSHILSPFDLVLLDMTPLGHREPLLSVDIVDPGTASVKEGDIISVGYTPAAPRFAIVTGATNDYLWRNFGVTTGIAALAFILILAASYLLHEDPHRIWMAALHFGDRFRINQRV